MTRESDHVAALRALASSPAARGLADDAAVLDFGGSDLVLTLDTLVEGVHFLSDDPPQDIGWKLVAVNVSDLSAKGATPVGCLYSHALGGSEWDAAFLEGLAAACTHFAIPLLGGDTVRMPAGAPRSFSLTALGRGPAGRKPPERKDARPGDTIWVSGPIGDAGLGLAVLTGTITAGPDASRYLADRYRRPMPQPALGAALAPHVHAMMDVSDGLLVDAERMARASGCAIAIDAQSVPLSDAALSLGDDTLEARLPAMTAGDDYCLLFSAPPASTGAILDIADELGATLHAVGTVSEGLGLSLTYRGSPVSLPERLGYEH